MRSKRKNRFNLKADERGIWHCDFSVAGIRIQRSTYTEDRAQAEEWCSKAESDTWRQVRLGEQPTLLWEEAVAKWFSAKQADRKRDLANDADKARILEPFFKGRRMDELRTLDVDDALDDLTARRGLVNGTRNRYRAFILGVANYVRKKGYKVAELHPERRKEPKGRIVWITKEQAGLIVADLHERELLHLHRMVLFSFVTGLRQSNVTGLSEANADLRRKIAWVDPEGAKAGEPIPVPLSDEGVGILTDAMNCPVHGFAAQRGVREGRRLFFTYYGNAIEQPANTAWDKCLARTKTREDFTWHCMRHTWASWHVMGLMSADGTPTPLEVLQKLGAWADIKMVLKYAHLSPDYVAKFVGSTGLHSRPANVIPMRAA